MPAAPRRGADKGGPKAARRLPGLPPSPRDGAARDGRRGAAALGALLGGGNASLARCRHSARALPARPPAPTGAGARGAQGGGAAVTLAARPAANGRAGRTRAARGARVSRGTGCQSPTSHSPRPAPPAAPPPARSAARCPCPSLPPVPGAAPAWGAFCGRRCLVPGPGCEGVAAALEHLPHGLGSCRQRQASAARPPRDARGAGSAPGALPRWGPRGGAAMAAARRLYLAWRRGGWRWGTPCCKIRAINTAPGMGVRPRAAGSSFELRWVPSSAARRLGTA